MIKWVSLLNSLLITTFVCAEKIDNVEISYTPSESLQNIKINKDHYPSLLSSLGTSIQKDGSISPAILFKVTLPDPTTVPNFNITSSDGLVDIDGQFRNMQLFGLSEFNITHLKMNIGSANISITMQAGSLRLEGEYNLEGSVTFLSVDGGGSFWMKGDKSTIIGSVTLQRTPSDGQLQIDQINLDGQVDEISLNFEGLLGGGSWGSFSNTLLNQLSDLIFEQVRSSLIGELKSELQKKLNIELSETPPELFLENSTAIFDDILFRACEHLSFAGYDHYQLSDFESSFAKKIYFLDINGKVKVSNGSVFGLTTLRRTADILITFENGSILMEAEMGFGNLTSNFDWEASIMNIGPSGGMSISLTRTSIIAKLRSYRLTTSGAKFNLEEFKMEKMGQVWTDVNGLGSLDFLMEIVVNLITNSLKYSLTDVIIGPIKNALQKQLDNLPDDFI